MSDDHRYRLGCDVGGTFTDFLLLDTVTGEVTLHKQLTTPADPSDGVLAGAEALDGMRPGFLRQVRHIIHGTTLVSNAVIERKGARTALLTTRGFRDILELRRHMRNDVYDVTGDLQLPLVPRDLRYEVDERMSADGRVLTPLRDEHLRDLCHELRTVGVESVAISFLHAYAYPQHERLARQLVETALPGISVSVSSDVHPEIKEFERTSTTVVNAYAKPLVERYLARLDDQLRARGSSGAFLLMHSAGGVMARATAAEFPVRIIESGPVAGVLAAGRVGADIGASEVLAFDMGGTTAKVCVITDQKLPIANEFEIDRALRFRKGSGLPVAVPAVDLVEVGAGGGSIAIVNERGLLSVGPASAGADPGPACYGRGGGEPTVTDADLVLGYLNPSYFLGGRMALDATAATSAVGGRVASLLGMDADHAAWGIHDQVNENMAAAMAAYLAEHGLDPRGLAMVAFGGAGPVHAYGVARKLGIREVVVPRAAGVASALGFLIAPVTFSLVKTQKRALHAVDVAAVRAGFAAMRAEAEVVLRKADAAGELRYEHAVDVCYAGQDHSMTLPVAPDGADLSAEALSAAFLSAYHAQYGYAYDDVPLQLMRLRLTGVVAGSGAEVRVASLRRSATTGGARKGQRRAFDPTARRWDEFAVYDRYELVAGVELPGPAVVEESESTTVVGRGAHVSATKEGHLRIRLPEAT